MAKNNRVRPHFSTTPFLHNPISPTPTPPSLCEAGVPIAELKFLLNHAAGNVTMGYLNPSLDHLRGYQERASAYVLDALGLRWTEGEWPPRLRSERRVEEPEESTA